MSDDTKFVKVELCSFQDICNKIKTLEAERNHLGKVLEGFAKESHDAWTCGDGSIHDERFCAFEDRFDREYCYDCRSNGGCTAKKGKLLEFYEAGDCCGHTLFVEGI